MNLNGTNMNSIIKALALCFGVFLSMVRYDIYRLQRSCGNVMFLQPVSLSVCQVILFTGGSQHALGRHPPGQTYPSTHWGKHPPPADTPSWADISQHALGQIIPQPPGRTATTADGMHGTHPTRMHSCYTCTHD